jgi:hypothetical protein
MTEPLNPVALAERILALFSEAKFSSTYKHAVMLGHRENARRSPRPSTHLTCTTGSCARPATRLACLAAITLVASAGAMACSSDNSTSDQPALSGDTSVADTSMPSDSTDADSATSPGDVTEAPRPLTVITINAGTTPGLAHDSDEESGRAPYSGATAGIVDESYQNSLSWNPAEARLTEWLALVDPDIVAFQEIFHDPWCDDINRPEDAPLDLVCGNYTRERPRQVRRLMGPDFQIVCGEGKPDTCIAVHTRLGPVTACDGQPENCLTTWDGFIPLSRCTSRDRLGRAFVASSNGRPAFNIIAGDGTSGLTVEDALCRRDIFSLVFDDKGDGVPLVRPDAINLVLGDFNVDPILFAGGDESADYLLEHIGDDHPFQWHSPIDPSGPRSYALGVSIDHVASDGLTGACVIPGSSPGVAPVWDRIYWDHRPIVCELTYAAE